MGEVKEQKRTPKTNQKTSIKTAVNPRHAGRKPRGKAKKRSIHKNIEPGESGAVLRNAIEEEVARKSERIAESLVNRTIDGNMVGVRLVVDITGAKNPPPKKKPTGPSLADFFASQPQWEDPPDPEADIGFGGRETEQY